MQRDLAHFSGCKRSENERPEAQAPECRNLMSDVAAEPADLAIAAFGKFDLEVRLSTGAFSDEGFLG